MNPIKKNLLQPYIYFIIILIGISLKFYKLESNYFWEDEIETILHTSGISDNDYMMLISEDTVLNVNYYQDLLHLNTQNYTIGSQLKGLFSMPQFAPLHHALLIFWHRIVGDEYIHYRLFTIFTFILLLPFLFLLCKTLFNSELTGWMAACLFSVSPFFSVFTQEARYYILWAFFIILSHYVFLKAIQINKIKWWIAYTVIGILSMFTSFFSSLFIIGHILYIGFRKKELWLKYLFTIVIIGLCYLPWIITLISYADDINRSMSWLMPAENPTIWGILIGQLTGMAAVFASFEPFAWSSLLHTFFGIGEGFHPQYLTLIIHVFILTLIIAAIIYLVKKSSKDNLLFLVFVTLPFVLFVFAFDLSKGGWVSFIWRYHIISFIGIFLIMINFFNEKFKQKKSVFIGMFFALVLLSIISTMKVSTYKHWTGYLSYNDESAVYFSKFEYPLLVIDYGDWYNNSHILMFMNLCKSDSICVLRTSGDVEIINQQMKARKYSEVFVIHATDGLIKNLKSQYGTSLDSLDIGLWPPTYQINF